MIRRSVARRMDEMGVDKARVGSRHSRVLIRVPHLPDPRCDVSFTSSAFTCDNWEKIGC